MEKLISGLTDIEFDVIFRDEENAFQAAYKGANIDVSKASPRSSAYRISVYKEQSTPYNQDDLFSRDLAIQAAVNYVDGVLAA